MSDATASTKVFDLVHPVEFKGATYKSFTARRPQVHDLRTFLKTVDTDAIGAVVKVLANMCEVDEPIMAKVDIADFKIMREWFEDFFVDKSDA